MLKEKTQTQIRSDFSKVVDVYKKYRRDYPDRAYELIYDFCPDREAEVLDIGCGTGLVTNHLARHYKHITGVDRERKMMNVAMETSPANVSFVEAHAENLPFKDSTFDLITVGAAYHWFDYNTAGKELNRVLKPNGKLCVFWKSGRDNSRAYLPSFALKNLKRYIPDLQKTNEPITSDIFSRVGFDKVRSEEFDFDGTYSKEEILGYIRSNSTFNLLDQKQKKECMELNAESVDQYSMNSRFVFKSKMVMWFVEK